MRYIFFLYKHWFCQKLIKDRRLHCFCFHFHLNILWKISKTTHWIFQICQDCDHKTICIPKLNVLNKISLSEDFKNIFFFIIMSSNLEKMFPWNASIWVGGPCISTSGESEPSWLEPELELKDFQLGSARGLFLFSSKSIIGRNEPKFWFLKRKISFMLLNHSFQLPKTPFTLYKLSCNWL